MILIHPLTPADLCAPSALIVQEALKQQESHEKALLAVARLHITRGELEEAQAQCTTLMRHEPGNQEASLMLADLMMQKSEWEVQPPHAPRRLAPIPEWTRSPAAQPTHAAPSRGLPPPPSRTAPFFR